jgi:Holliday junction resolvase RusA-like endonuclease
VQIPAGWSIKRRAPAEAATIYATNKPDADNVLKGIKDGCNGIMLAMTPPCALDA